MAIASAVITGALTAGGSITATIRRTLLGRLGSTDLALTSVRPMRGSLAEALAGEPSVRLAVPILMFDASVRHPDTGAVAPRVRLLGVPPRFFRLFPDQSPGRIQAREAVISAPLARETGIGAGGDLLVSIGMPDDVRMTSLFARRDPDRLTRTFRLGCQSVADPDGPGGFSLDLEPAPRRTVLMDYDWLADRMGLAGRAHAILLDTGGAAPIGALTRRLRAQLRPEDLGLKLGASGSALRITSLGVTLLRDQVQGIRDAMAPLRRACETASIQLATRIATPSGRAAHYVTVADAPGLTIPDDRIVLSQWLAETLKSGRDDLVSVSWLEPSDIGSYPERTVALRSSGVLPTPVAAHAGWIVPEFAGITDARRISEWDPPFPVDLRKITPRDELYWERYRAAPQAFVSERVLRRMWSADGLGGDWVTAIRVAPSSAPEGGPDQELKRLERALLDSRALRRYGPALRSIRTEALQAAGGSTDFRGLMVGLSLFLVASALGLAALMMRLTAERRAFQIGLLLAIGRSPRQACAGAAMEGALSAVAGALLGAPAGIPIAAALVYGLNHGWSGAVAGQAIRLSLTLESVAAGFASAALLGAGVAWLIGRGMADRSPAMLLGGWRALQAERFRSREPMDRLRSGFAGSSWLAALAAVTGIGLLGLGVTGHMAPATAYLSAGALMLISGLLGLHTALALALQPRPGRTARGGRWSMVWRIAWRNAALGRRHSVLIAGLIAAASFLLVTVAANVRTSDSLDTRNRHSGSGGFDLIVRSAVPVPISMDRPEGRRRLGFGEADERLFRGVEIVPFWVSGGTDTSCLNLARPTAPRIMGVTRAMAQRGGFTIETAGNAGADPWQLLFRSGSGSIPVFGDADSVRWILHSGLGRIVDRRAPSGLYRLRFAGLLRSSVFADALLVAEDRFHTMFPEVTAPSLFMIRTPDGRFEELARAMRRNLGPLGVEVRPTREALAELMSVQNTYLAAFLVLGGLGIILGAAGLGAVLLRTASERRSEFALLAAIGKPPGMAARILIRESGVLLLYGLALGVAAALLASYPSLASGGAAVNWRAVGMALGGVASVGLLSTIGAARLAARGRPLEALRTE